MLDKRLQLGSESVHINACNMRNVLILLLSTLTLLAIGCRSHSQLTRSTDHETLYPVSMHGLWGYADEEGTVVIDYKYEQASFFVGGRAAAKSNGKYGFINRNGHFITKPIYDSIGYYTLTQANVIRRGKSLTIDNNGKKQESGILVSVGGNSRPAAHPTEYFELIDDKYVLDAPLVANEQRLDPLADYQVDDFTFDDVRQFSWKSMIVVSNNSSDLYLLNNGGLKGLNFDHIEPIRYHWNNQASTQYAKFYTDGRWGVMSSSGDILIEARYENIDSAYGQYYLVEYQPDCWGYVSQSKQYF